MLRSAYRNLPSVSRLLPYPPERPRVFPTGGFSLIDIGEKVEEEKLAHYRPERFYAARLGEVFQSRYQAIGKLGYGAHSTAWLCRDLRLETPKEKAVQDADNEAANISMSQSRSANPRAYQRSGNSRRTFTSTRCGLGTSGEL